MPASVAQKLKIKEGFTLLTINAPKDFKKSLGELPAGARLTTSGKKYDQLHWFVLNKAQLDKELEKVLQQVSAGVLAWVYYPKGTSSIQTDLTRDKGWENFFKHDEFQWITLVSFNNTWSTFAFRLKTESDKTKEEKKPAKRPIFDYVDPVKKTVKLPADLAKLLTRNKKANTFFQSLSFTNKKEYIEWIISAKREETRNERLKGTEERLLKGWKNPGNM